jgi:general secretion pathway protein L
MPELLLLRLDPVAGAESVAFMTCTPDGVAASAPVRGSLAEAAMAAAGRRVVVLVPGAEVVCFDVDLPALPPGRLLSAVPYALEESVAADVETLHFAVGRRAASGRTLVATVDRTLLQGWLEALRAVGLEPDAMHADCALMAGQPGHLVVFLDGPTAHLARAGEPTLSLPGEPLAAAVDLALQGAALVDGQADAAGGLGLLVMVDASEGSKRAPEIEALRSRFAALQVRQLPDGALPWLASQLAAASPVNLLQGAFAPRRQHARDWRQWWLAAALAAAALVLHIGSQALELRQLARAERELDARLAEALAPLQGSLPPQASPRDTRRSIEALLARARAGSGTGDAGGGLLPALAAFAEARSATPATRLESIGYDGAAVELRIRAADAGSLEALANALRAGGWQAEVAQDRIRLRSARSSGGAAS